MVFFGTLNVTYTFFPPIAPDIRFAPFHDLVPNHPNPLIRFKRNHTNPFKKFQMSHAIPLILHLIPFPAYFPPPATFFLYRTKSQPSPMSARRRNTPRRTYNRVSPMPISGLASAPKNPRPPPRKYPNNASNNPMPSAANNPPPKPIPFPASPPSPAFPPPSLLARAYIKYTTTATMAIAQNQSSL